jgi:outer membrane immunogenic protein
VRTIHLFAAAAAISLAAGAAYAGDATDWGGFYAGVNVGAGFPSSRQSTTTNDPNGALVDPSGRSQAVLFPNSLGRTRDDITYGAQAGYNYQVGKWVYGVEGDYTEFGITNHASYSGHFYDTTQADPSYVSHVNGKAEQNGLITLRGRVGRDVGGVLLYATGGLALANVKAGSSFANYNVGGTTDYFSGETHGESVGGVVGGGAEFHLTKKISMKLEYLYYDLGTVRYNTSPNYFTSGDNPGVYQSAKYVADGNLLRVGFNYHF